MTRSLLSFSVAVLALAWSTHAMAQPPPRMMVAPPVGVRVRVVPPPPRVEVRPLAPSPQHLWVPGYWAWQEGRHVWVPGLWSLPPAVGHSWVEPRWTFERGEWAFVPGHWASTGAGVVIPPAPLTARPAAPGEIVVEQPPPPSQIEPRPLAPPPGSFWVAGHWRWEGRWVWEPGRWELQRRGMLWEPAHWVRFGARWRYLPGHWRGL